MSAPPAAPVPADGLARLRRLIEESGDMLCRHAPGGTCLYASPASTELLGFEPEELVGRSGILFVHPEDVEGVTESRAEVLAGPERCTVVCRVRHKEGRDVWVESTVHAIRDPGTGAVVEVLSSSRDVTERMHARALLRELERRFRLAMADCPNRGLWRNESPHEPKMMTPRDGTSATSSWMAWSKVATIPASGEVGRRSCIPGPPLPTTGDPRYRR